MNKENIEDVYPMSDIQKGMVYANLIDPSRVVYNDQLIYYIPLAIDFKRFVKAIELMVEVHPILRTSFNLDSFSQEVQIVHKKIEPIVKFKDLTSFDDKEHKHHLENYMKEERNKPYNFNEAPLWRIDLFNLKNEISVYLIQFHHSILDGWSVAAFNTQLLNLYSRLENDKNYFPEKISYGIKEAVLEELAEKKSTKTIEHWKNKLNNYQKLDFFSTKKTANQFKKKFNSDTSSRVNQYSSENDLHPKDIVLGAFAYIMKTISVQEDFILGMVSNTRPPVRDSEKVLGCFLNTLPMRFSFKQYENLTWLEYYKNIELEMKELKTKDRSTLHEISKIASKEKRGENPFFDIIYNYVDFSNAYKKIDHNPTGKVQEEIVESFELTNTFFDTTVSINKDHSIILSFNVTRSLKFDYSLEKIVDYIEKLLLYSFDNPKIQIKNASFLPPEEMCRKYWLKKFRGDLPLLNLPSIKHKSEPKTNLGQVLKTTFTKEDTILIRDYITEKEGTFALLVASLNVLLYRYTGQEDIIIGSQFTDTTGSESDKNIKPNATTLVLRNTISNDYPFNEFYKQIRQEIGVADSNKMYSYDRLVKELGLNENGRSDNLFSIMVSYQTTRNPEKFTNNIGKITAGRKIKPQHKLSFNFVESIDHLQLEVIYSEDVYEHKMMVKFINHFKQLLNNIVINHSRNIGELEYLSEEEQTQLLYEFNATKVSYPKDKTTIDLFGGQVKKNPDKVAVYDANNSYTYNDLDQKSDSICSFLIQKVGNTKDPVGIVLERSANLIAILLGVLKSGKSYIPIDPSLPKDRIDYIIENSNTKVIIANHTLDQKDTVTKNITRIDPDDLLILETETNKTTTVLPKDTAYIIYTSGSTGNPKGVEIGHQSLTNFLTSMQARPGVSENDILYAVTTYSFDISILEFFTPLISGATVYVANNEILSDPSLIMEDLKKVKASIIQATPSFYQMLFDAGWEGSSTLKVLCGGDLLNKSLAKQLIQYSEEVWNMYGPTETTIWSTIKKIEQPDDASNIGQPINNTQIYILDDQLKIVPEGVSGKIFIGGDGLAKSYFKNPVLTMEKFINNPYDQRPGGLTDDVKIYDTGDLGKWLPSGSIEFLGRNDFQVKIRGYRIELDEIENVLLQYSPDIKQAILKLKEIQGDKTLVAYYTTKNKVDKSVIKNYLNEKLPRYMIPGFFKELESFPLTPNGKVNRKALPDISDDDIIRGEYIMPQDEMEVTMVEIIKGVLGKHDLQVGITDNFFDLGLTSLTALRALNQFNSKLNLKLKPLDFFQFPNIQSLIKNVLKIEDDNNSYSEEISEEMDSILDIF